MLFASDSLINKQIKESHVQPTQVCEKDILIKFSHRVYALLACGGSSWLNPPKPCMK